MWTALTIVAIVLVVACLVAAVLGGLRPDRFRVLSRPGVRWGLAAAAVVLAFGVTTVELRPKYEVAVSVPIEPVAGEASAITVTVENFGAWTGTFEADCLIGGESCGSVRLDVPSGEKASVDVAVPEELLPGDQTIEIAGSRATVRLLRPAAFEVASLERATSPVKSGGRAKVTATIVNTGDVEGTYTAKLRVDGKVVDREKVTVAGGSTTNVTFKPRLKGEREHTIAVDEASVTVRSLRTKRYASGHELRWKIGRGAGELTITNDGKSDGLVILSSSKSAPTTKIAIYVRGRSKAVVDQIPDGKYWVYYELGRDWAPSRKGFLNVGERGRFAGPLDFGTTYEADGSYYYDIWSIGLTPAEPDASDAVPVERVDEGDFPTLDGGAPSQTV